MYLFYCSLGYSPSKLWKWVLWIQLLNSCINIYYCTKKHMHNFTSLSNPLRSPKYPKKGMWNFWLFSKEVCAYIHTDGAFQEPVFWCPNFWQMHSCIESSSGFSAVIFMRNKCVKCSTANSGQIGFWGL